MYQLVVSRSLLGNLDLIRFSPTQGIAPTLIIVRVGLGVSVNNVETTVQALRAEQIHEQLEEKRRDLMYELEAGYEAYGTGGQGGSREAARRPYVPPVSMGDDLPPAFQTLPPAVEPSEETASLALAGSHIITDAPVTKPGLRAPIGVIADAPVRKPRA